jgi:hypothetical protein
MLTIAFSRRTWKCKIIHLGLKIVREQLPQTCKRERYLPERIAPVKEPGKQLM